MHTVYDERVIPDHFWILVDKLIEHFLAAEIRLLTYFLAGNVLGALSPGQHI